MSALVLAAALAQAVTTVPVSGPHQLHSGMPVIARIARNGVTGTVAIWGADLPGVNSDNYRLMKAVDSANVDTDLAYVAFANYNIIVKRNGVVLEYAASPADLTQFAVADNAGSLRVTIGDGTPTPNGDTIEVFIVTPVALVAAAVTENVIVNITSKDLLWAVGSDTASFSTSVVAIEPTVP